MGRTSVIEGDDYRSEGRGLDELYQEILEVVGHCPWHNQCPIVNDGIGGETIMEIIDRYSAMILEPRVLRDDHIPETIVHRDSEIDHLVALLSPDCGGRITEGVWVHGPPGTGKTVTVRAVLERFGTEYPTVETVAVDGWHDKSRHAVLCSVLEGLADGEAGHRTSTPVDELLDRIRDAVSGPTIVFVDEAGQLTEMQSLRDLYELPEVTPVIVCNKYGSVLDRLDPTDESRLTPLAQVRFGRYGDAELVDILERRVEIGVQPGVVGDGVLAHIADRAAGDARRAIGILRTSLERASATGSGLTTELVDESVPDADVAIAASRIRSTTCRQRTVLEVLADVGPARTGVVYDRYCERTDECRSKRTVREWLRHKFQEYNLARIDDSGSYDRYELTDVAADALEEVRD